MFTERIALLFSLSGCREPETYEKYCFGQINYSRKILTISVEQTLGNAELDVDN